jgi:hypothetical protein
MTRGRKFVAFLWDYFVPTYAVLWIAANDFELFGWLWLGIPIFAINLLILGENIDKYIDGEWRGQRSA